MPIITIDYIIQNSISIALCNETNNNPERITKLIANIENKVLWYIDVEIFGDPVEYPDKLQQTVLFLVESYYVSYWTKGREFGMREKKSIRIDDYSETRSQERESDLSPLYFYDIPVTKEHLDNLNSYKLGSLSYWYFNYPC